jgi:hypothetical protein
VGSLEEVEGFQIVCVCDGTAFVFPDNVQHSMPPCMTFDMLEPGEFARGLRMWWMLEKAERDENYKGCKRLGGGDSRVSPGWGCCKCRVYNGLGRDKCKRCGHECCGLKVKGAKE